MGHGDKREIFRPRGIAEFLEIGFDEGASGFAGAVGAEIKENHGVIVANHRARDCGFAGRGFRGDDGGNDKFVGDAFFVARADGGDGIGEFRIGVALNHGTVRFFDTLPAVVAVHGVVAADDGGDLADAVFAHLLFERAKEINTAIRRSVAAVHEAVDENALDLIFAGHAQQRVEMFDVRVDAAIADEAEQVQLARAATFHGFEKQRLAREFAGGDELINARDVHVHDASGADIQVAHFAIAHLSFRQADGGAGRLNQRVGKFFEQAVVIRLARERDGVAFGFGAIAPAVEDGKDHRFWAFRWRGHVAGQNTLSKASVPFGQSADSA